MPVRVRSRQPVLRARVAMALLALGIALSGCAEMSESVFERKPAPRLTRGGNWFA